MVRNQVTRRRSRSHWQGTLRMAGVFGLLICINVYFLFLRGGTSIQDLLKASAEKKPPPALLPPQAKGPGLHGAKSTQLAALARAVVEPAELLSEEDGRVVKGVVGPTDTLAAVFKREAIPPRTLAVVVDALGRVFDPRLVKSGHTYTLRFDGEDRLRAVEYQTSPATLLRVERRLERGESGREQWVAHRETAAVETQVVAIGGAIESSLYDAVKRAGEGTQLVGFFVDMFAWDINFYIDTKAGDHFKIIAEKLFLNGHFYKYGRVLAAEYSGKVGTFRAFWFEPEGQKGGYYNERGESIVKSLLKTPLKYVRISSSFDRRRFHPILHSERAHLGVDYAAPVGTPVWATASGRVVWRGVRGGAGNCVIVAHPGGMESIYMHLSRYAKGLETGDSVRQKQVIGYVGMSGLATGPHLHFSVKMGGHFVDPLRLKPAREAPLLPRYRPQFVAALAPHLEELGQIDVSPRRDLVRGATRPD